MRSPPQKSTLDERAQRPSDRLADVIGAVRAGGGRARNTGAELESSLTRRHFEYFENAATLRTMARTTRSIGSATAAAVAPKAMLDVESQALDALAGLGDDDFVEVQIMEPSKTRAVFPVGFLRRYLAAQSVPGRQVLVFDSDEEVSSEVAASMLGVSRPHLNHLLDAEEIPYRRVGNQRRIRVVDLNAFRERRDRTHAALREMADVVNESVGGWTY